MPSDIAVIRVYSNEMDASVAQQVLQDAGINAFIFKDDAGGMEPQLQLTAGVKLVVAAADATRGREIIGSFESAHFKKF